MYVVVVVDSRNEAQRNEFIAAILAHSLSMTAFRLNLHVYNYVTFLCKKALTECVTREDPNEHARLIMVFSFYNSIYESRKKS